MQESDEFRTFLKLSKRFDYAGDYVGAFSFLGLARKKVHHHDTWHKYKLGIIDHRHALLEAKYGSAEDARLLFRRASREIKSDAPVERANLLRDFGKFELYANNVLIARKKIAEALSLLEGADEALEHLDTHLTITRGFLAQVNLRTDREGALQDLRVTAKLLRGTKAEYELEPIECLVENLSVGVERQLYILRAIYLSLLLGNQSRAIEYTTLLGGKPLRGLYRIIL